MRAVKRISVRFMESWQLNHIRSKRRDPRIRPQAAIAALTDVMRTCGSADISQHQSR